MTASGGVENSSEVASLDFSGFTVPRLSIKACFFTRLVGTMALMDFQHLVIIDEDSGNIPVWVSIENIGRSENPVHDFVVILVVMNVVTDSEGRF